MATSSKVLWNLEKLRAEALTALDDRIAAKVLEVESYGNESALAERMADWRARQEVRLADLSTKLGRDGISNPELARFKIDPMPEDDGYSVRRAERELQSLQTRRGKIIAKSGALVADEDGHIALTKTQLAEFFDL
jgi:hypothetical protein